jgi:TonB family protein
MLRRKLSPWIGSLLFHGLLIAVPLALMSRAAPETQGAMLDIDISMVEGPAGTEAARPVMKPKPVPAVPRSRDSALPEPKDAARPTEEDARVPDAAPPTRDESEALAGTPGMSAEIGWENASRSVVRRGTLSFPRVLSALGQEAECEARITVTPLGMVSNVEITRSSGYTEIDASVETALRGYVFTRDYGLEKKNAIGIVKFRFRLERLD